MIATAIDRILGLAEPNCKNINGATYTDKRLERIDNELRANSIKMATLKSLVEYVHSMKEERKPGGYLVQVASPTEVRLISQLDDDRQRETLAVVAANIPEFQFNTLIPQENFVIGVQSKFVDGDPSENDKALILKFAGTVKNGTVTDYTDDGISQKAVVKAGVATNVEAEVPSPCRLAPYRTFTEVEQPMSSFIFRLSDDKYQGGVCCALYEADGGAWKNEAIKRVGAYLRNELEDDKDILVIA